MGRLVRGSTQFEATRKMSDPIHWEIGDELIIPGTLPEADQDEHVFVREITSEPFGSLRKYTISLADAHGQIKALEYDHGDRILVPESDRNAMGRYAVHFHLRTGADLKNPPHVLRNSAIVDSPKLGVVNHGGYVNIENNVGYHIDGSHFFTENGSEIGTIRGNLAIRSRGSGVPDPRQDIRTRGNENVNGAFDHGHEGNGFWIHSGAVTVHDNYAFGHRHAAFDVYPFPIQERGKEIKFQVDNLQNPAIAVSRGKQHLTQVSVTHPTLEFTNNVGATSLNGLVIRYLHRQVGFDTHSREFQDRLYDSASVYHPESRKVI